MIKELEEKLRIYNEAYRSGEPLVSDSEYDDLVEKLRVLDPNNDYLNNVEPERFDDKLEIKHPVPMLSTEKAYNIQQLVNFCKRVVKEASEIGVINPLFKATAKLDGMAGRDDGKILSTRGNGLVGYDVSNAFDRGVVAIGGRGKGLGEIVMSQSYFDDNLKDIFTHPRNAVVGAINSLELNENMKRALNNEAIHFVPYNKLKTWTGHYEELVENIENIKAFLLNGIDYPYDGIIVEAIDEKVRIHMGSTAHHNRFMIAVKEKGEVATTVVENICWQVGRTGNITPVLNIQPTFLSGATIRNVTGHNAGMISKMQIGPGAVIEIIRSGEVIPKLENVITPSHHVTFPSLCPSCNQPTYWDRDFLKCINKTCKAQIEQNIKHWFSTLGTSDWFGIKSIQQIVENGFNTISKVYNMTIDDFKSCGFGPVQSQNLFDSLVISKTKEVEDWRFLAAFGISNLGKGDSKKLLSHFKIEELENIKESDIRSIHGFGEKTSGIIYEELQLLMPFMKNMMGLRFNLSKTPLKSEVKIVESRLNGKRIVFTGKMLRGTRDQMKVEAERLGAVVQSSVSKTTDLLVCGENVGNIKMEKASKLGVEVINENDFYNLIS